VLLPLVALAHVVSFTFTLPRTVGNATGDGGIFTLTWVDQIAAGPKTDARLYATRAAWSPLEAMPDASQVIEIATGVSTASPIDLYDWDTADAGEGCWQPYALMDDSIEGLIIAKAEGRVTVMRGTNVPPAIWVTTHPAALPGPDKRLTLEWDVDEPDDESVITVSWVAGDGERGTLATGLVLDAGTRSASYTFDVQRLPPKAIWLRVEIHSGDGGWCDSWWRGFVTGRSDELADAGVDGGTDGGADAGPLEEPDAGTDAGTEPPPPRPHGCGCSGSWGHCGLALLLLLRRRRP
jgi:hypothetical protein